MALVGEHEGKRAQIEEVAAKDVGGIGFGLPFGDCVDLVGRTLAGKALQGSLAIDAAHHDARPVAVLDPLTVFLVVPQDERKPAGKQSARLFAVAGQARDIEGQVEPGDERAATVGGRIEDLFEKLAARVELERDRQAVAVAGVDIGALAGLILLEGLEAFGVRRGQVVGVDQPLFDGRDARVLALPGDAAVAVGAEQQGLS